MRKKEYRTEDEEGILSVKKQEALRFGNDAIYMEKLIEWSKAHVEDKFFKGIFLQCDSFGRVRDCSCMRKNQKNDRNK